VAIGRGGDGPERDTVSVYDRGTLDALFAPIYGTFARLLAATGSLGNAAVYGHIGEIQADHPVIGIEHYPSQSLHDPLINPLVASAAQGGCRARLVGYLAVSAAEDEHLHEFVEDYPIGYARPMTAQRMIYFSRW
jgi:hypothetical protein